MNKYFFAPFSFLKNIYILIITYFPGEIGFILRGFYYRGRFKRVGENVRIDVGVQIDGPELISIGNNVHIDKYCILSTGAKLIGKIIEKKNNLYSYSRGEIVLGSNIHIAQFCILMGYGGIHINDNCVLSSGCKIYSLTNIHNNPHKPSEVVSIMPYDNAHFLLSPVYLGFNVWLALNVIVMPSVSVGRDSFCVSNSILKKNFSKNSYISTRPKEAIGRRFSKELSKK